MKACRRILSCIVGLAVCIACTGQTLDASLAHRYAVRATLYGIGHANVYDTYLSPYEYKGIEAKVLRESMRMTRLLNGRVSVQSLFHAGISYTHNRQGSNHCLSASADWNYGMHWHFPVNRWLKLLAGAMGEIGGNGTYNPRNSNNPGSVRASAGLSASGMAICNVRLKRYPVTLRYQIDIPLLGMAFAPDYRQSYYEIFALGNTEGILHFTSLYNRPSTRQVLSVDLPVRNAKLRIAYLCDLEQSTAGGLRFHRYSHTLMAGFVRTFYRIRGKRPKAVPVYQTYNGKRL